MSIMRMLDYYPIIHKQYASLRDIKYLLCNDDTCVQFVIHQLIDDCKKSNEKFYVDHTNVLIPMHIFMKYFNLNYDRLKRYHDTLSGFFMKKIEGR